MGSTKRVRIYPCIFITNKCHDPLRFTVARKENMLVVFTERRVQLHQIEIIFLIVIIQCAAGGIIFGGAYSSISGDWKTSL